MPDLDAMPKATRGRCLLRHGVRLAPGDCLVFYNTRMLHARTAFEADTGTRHLQGCYAELDGLASTLALLEGRTRV